MRRETESVRFLIHAPVINLGLPCYLFVALSLLFIFIMDILEGLSYSCVEFVQLNDEWGDKLMNSTHP